MMKRKLRNTLLVILFLFIIVIVVEIGEYLVNQEQNKIIKVNQSKIIQLTSTFESEIQDIISLVEITAKLDDVSNLPFADQIKPELRGIEKDQDLKKRQIAQDILFNKKSVKAVYFTMPNANMYMIEPYSLQEKISSSNFSFRDWYNGILQTQTTYISESFLPQGVFGNSISVVTPVKKSGQFVGIWGILVELDYLKTKLNKILDKNQNVVLIDHNRNIVVSSNDDSSVNYNSLTGVRNTLDGKSGNAIESINEINYFITYIPVTVGTHTWALIITDPYDLLIEHVQFIRILYVAISLGVGIFGFLCITRKLNTCKILFGKETELTEPDITSLHDHPFVIERKSGRKICLVIITSVIIFGIFYIGFEHPQTISTFKTSFVIQNLRGDNVDTWMNWKITPDEKFHIHVQQSHELTPHRLDIITNVISSEETVQIDDSFLHKGPKGSISEYYLGWAGAIKRITQETKFPIPIHFHQMTTDTGDGNVVIRLSELKNVDGYSGYTKTYVDDENHEILKSHITIYNVNQLSDVELATIVRHELGHAFGLAHSSAPEDLMYPTIKTNYPYISQCDIDALVGLYNGNTKSQVICEK